MTCQIYVKFTVNVGEMQMTKFSSIRPVKSTDSRSKFGETGPKSAKSQKKVRCHTS